MVQASNRPNKKLDFLTQVTTVALPITAMAGQDISHWFNARTGDVKTHVDAERVNFAFLVYKLYYII